MRCINVIIVLVFCGTVNAQYKSTVEQYHVVGQDRQYMPMSVANFTNNKNWYAEGRYNYEDLKTFSLYLGKTFTGGNQLDYSVTPLFGGAVGTFNGISTGLNIDLEYQKLFFSLQSQYSFSTDNRINHFLYSWSELGYKPLSWVYGGLSLQQTRLYQTNTKLEPGVVLGLSYRNLDMPLYAFSPFRRDGYFIIGLTYTWEEKRKKNTLVQRIPE